MRHRYLLAALALLAPTAGARAIEPADLKPGLVATYRDARNDANGPSVTRLEPTVALTLAKGEAPHPGLGTGALMTWSGHINIARAGKYTFSAATAGGDLTVKVGGKDALGAELQFDGGVVPFEATFHRTGGDGACRVELFWQGPGFIKEPLAYQFLGHLPKDRPKTFDRDGQLEHGRFKFEELSCAKCHRPTADDKTARTLAEHTGPNLADVAKRAYPGWIYAWLGAPAKLRPHTTMPKTLADDDAGAAERYAVTQYLVSLAGKPLDVYKLPTVPPNDLKQSMDRGRVLYHVTGCAACHNDPIARKKKDEEDEKEALAPADYVYGQNTLAGPTAKYGLGALGSKFRPETLAAYLQNPLKTNPHGRMPNMNLSPAEATDIARYLCRTQDETVTPDKLPAPRRKPAEVLGDLPMVNRDKPGDNFDKLPADKQWALVGARVFAARGCVNCHSTDPGGKFAQPTGFSSLDKVKADTKSGCLNPQPNPAKNPAYTLDPKEREALAAFLKGGFTGAGSAAPAYQARVALKRFNCLNCHQRDGEGGIPVELADQMRQMEKAENADDVRPPVLTGVGHKTRTPWMRAILTQSGRARPWMQLRMPQYGEPNVGFLPEAIASLEGTVPDDTVHVVGRTAAKIAAGRTIIGKGGLGCISCHDIGGVANTGTRGPDLSTINQRVRYEWYERWLSQPLRMAPGTRMPQAFIEGKSTLKTVFDGDPHEQAEAMWAYLALGRGLPLPDGLEPPKGLVIAVRDRPEILRTFMPDAGAKAIAVGYPGYVSLAFSADQCRLAYAWAGNFLDASPVWNNRGGAPAKLLGQKFWTAPAGHPWGLTADAKSPPDFPARANNPAFGLPLPLEPARIYDGPMAVQFDGYSLDRDGRPTFRYRLDETGKGTELVVAETPAPLKSLLATGLARKFEATVPGGLQAWFFAGTTGGEPRLYDTAGKPVKLDLKADEVSASAVGTRLVLPDGDRAAVLEAAGAPAGTAWRFVRHKGGGWLAVLKLPAAKAEQKLAFALNLYALPKDDDSLLKELFGP
ncbi:MAG: c-type cytochrome [Planctomycetes bacterium]|nr:c-type cytochrome [Planctomycetota bacterium]